MPPSAAIIDADLHPTFDNQQVQARLPQPWRTRFEYGGSGGPGSLGFWNPQGVSRSDAVTPDGDRIEASPAALGRFFLDQNGIEYAILNPADLGLALSPELDFAAAVVAARNDVMVQHWLPADPRLRASLVVAPTDPARAAAEIERLGDHPGVVQVLMPSGAQMPYGHRFYHPIYHTAVDHGLPVAIHPGSEGVGVSGAPTAAGYPSSYLEWHTGLVANFIGHLISLVTEGVFAKFPQLKFVLVEGGVSWLPPILWRLDKNWKALRQTAPWLDRLPSEIVSDHVLLTTQPLEEPENRAHLHQILDMFDADRMLMFSTDFPHWDGDTPDFTAKTLPQKLKARVMSETARELYKLPRRDDERSLQAPQRRAEVAGRDAR